MFTFLTNCLIILLVVAVDLAFLFTLNTLQLKLFKDESNAEMTAFVIGLIIIMTQIAVAVVVFTPH